MTDGARGNGKAVRDLNQSVTGCGIANDVDGTGSVYFDKAVGWLTIGNVALDVGDAGQATLMDTRMLTRKRIRGAGKLSSQRPPSVTGNPGANPPDTPLFLQRISSGSQEVTDHVVLCIPCFCRSFLRALRSLPARLAAKLIFPRVSVISQRR